MWLNTIAGRTYNDLTQYPVFPWIIADYDSDQLDLDDPKKWAKTFRDLRKPVGALNPERLSMFVERYNSFDDDSMPKFHYGTHYSSAGTVMFYLIRMEPFSTEAIRMQDGKFDHADRLFDSIPATWWGCFTNAADVKELIPEFFYLAEFLRNSNEFNMGMKQSSGRALGDVLLPPWAKTPEDFVRINRQALESEYVSQNLHHWIDLVFGFKQRGREAEKAHNVFFHLTYEDSVDIDAIEDKTLREATIAQIEHFGQTPTQLLDEKHPKRYSADDIIPSVFVRLNDLQLYVKQQVTGKVALDNPLLFIHHCTDSILTLGLDRILGIHKWKNSTPEYIPPFSFELERRSSSNPRQIGVHFAVS